MFTADVKSVCVCLFPPAPPPPLPRAHTHTFTSFSNSRSSLFCRFKLTQIAVDTSAGPFKNYTVVFLGSDNGHVLKILASTEGANASFSTQLLEDIDVYNPNKSDHLSSPCRVLSCSLSVCFFSSSLVSFVFFVLTWSLLLRSVFRLDRHCPPTLKVIVTPLRHPVQLLTLRSLCALTSSRSGVTLSAAAPKINKTV